MALSNDLIKKFVDLTNESNNTPKKETYLYGTVHRQNNETYVKIDGSDILTPVANIVDSQNGDRVMLTIENHTATIIGNFTYPPSQRDTIHAQETADEALDAAGKARESANAAKESAEILTGKANEALSTAQAAQQTANKAVGDAATAQGQANTALQEANKANTAAGTAKGIADQAVIDASNAKKQADQALENAATADEKAVNAQKQADQAVSDAENAKNLADAAQEDVDAVKEDVAELEAGVSNANTAAQTAQSTADQAVQAAGVAKEAADKAQEDADTANEALITTQSTANTALQKANTAQSTADGALASASSAQASIKTIQDDVATSQAEIEALATSLETVSNTMTADYARKTDVSETTAQLQSQISQNAAQIQTTVTKITEVDETVGKAAQDAQAAAEEAQRLAGLAQTQADTATADAAKAQTAANTAKQAADKAQEDATKANQAAVDADAKAVKAAQDLATAQQNLTNVTNRVGATEEEIEAAKAEVIKAQNAANQANTDAQNAAQAAQAAQSTADTAKTNAANAQTAANNAAANAANAQSTANQAVADAEAAQQTANEAKQAASAAQSTANQAVSDAAKAQIAAQNAQKAADDADEKLEQAKIDLAAAQENLTSVTNRVGATEEEIEQAKIDLAAAQKAADDAQDDADAAKLAAQEAANKAQTAQNTADQAVQNALTAQQTANTAKDNAATAQNKANEAAGAAATAQQTATAAQNKANQAASDLAKAEQNLADVTSRVGATEEEIEAAQQAVAVAKKAADDAQADATAAQNAADQAAQDAANAQTTADQAQQAADDAQDAADKAQKAADDAQDAADALAIRVTNAETAITQNADLIKLAATKTEVATTLGGYYTKTQADAAMQVKAESILSTVSSTYQTKSAMSSYPTTTQMNSAISQKADEINLSVQTSINKTVKEVKRYYTSGGGVVVLPETAPAPTMDGDILPYVPLTPGVTYTVLYDDTPYVCTAISLSEAMVGAVGIGNLSTFNGEDTGEPFVIVISPIETTELSILLPLTGVSPQTVSIIKGVATTPEKPTTYPPSGEWSEIEPSSGNIVSVLCTVYVDGTFSYSELSTNTAGGIADDALMSANKANSDILAGMTSANETFTNIYSELSILEGSIGTKVSSSEFNSYKTTVTNNINAAVNSAKEYVDGEIDSVVADVSTLQDTVASHTTSLSGITSRVQSTENSITSINGSITSITNRVTAAEQKITSDAIISTVSGTYATKTALASTEAKAADAKTFTDNAKNNYGYQYKYTITANGDANLYYPLILRGGNQNVNREIFVYRGYNDKAPAEWGGHSTTKGISLTLKIEANYGGWGGATYSWYIKELAELYGNVFAGAQTILSGMGFAIMLRGGGTTGATYYIYSDQPLEVNHATGVSPNFYYNSDQFLYNNDSTYKWNAPAPISYTDTVAKNIEAKKFTDAQTVQLNSVIEQKEDSILLQVAQTYATSSALTTLSATVGGIEGRVSSAEGNISTLTQTATGLTARLDSGVGGRNLVAGTSIDTVYSGNKGTATYKDVWTGKTIDIPTGTEYVVSFDAKADAAQGIYCFFYSPNTTLTGKSSTGHSSTSADGNCVVGITTEWKRYWVKWTQTAATAIKNVIVGRTYSTSNVYIRAVKFEAGNVPSAWSPAYAPEDAAKTATNYMSFSSSGLVVGDMTASTLGRNILIDSDSVDVRNGSTVLATFGETTRIGQLTGRNIYIDSDSVDFRNQNTVLARIATNNKTTTNPDTGASVNYAYTWFNTDGILSVDSDDTRLESESSDYKLSAQVRAATKWEEYSSPNFACVKLSTSDSTVSGIRNYSNMYLRPTMLSVNVNDDTDTGRLSIGYDKSLLQVNVWNVTTNYSSIVGLADDFFLVQVTDYNGATATASYYFKTDGLYQNTTRIFDKDGTARYADEISTPRRIKVNLATTDSTGTLFSGASDVTLGVYGTLPTGRGGTGITSNPSMLVNLGSTTAASVFAASPRPGVTGTLPLGNGGTGGTTAAAARANLATWMYAFVSGDTTYPGLARPDGTTTGYVRTPQSGIIPYQNGGHGTVGTSSWPFSNGYFTNLYKGGVAVADVNHTHEWTTVAITTAANCSDASWTGMYSAALNMVSIQGYLLYTPTADLSSGEEIQIGTVAEIGRTTRRIPVTINNNSTNSRRWMGEINTNGVIRLRASGALTKGTSYTIYINAVYFKDF